MKEKGDLEISFSCGTSECQLPAECLAKQKTEWEEDVKKRIETWILEAFPSSDFQKRSVVRTRLMRQRAGPTADKIHPGRARAAHVWHAADNFWLPEMFSFQ